MQSKEGEFVHFTQPVIVLPSETSVHAWLSRVEHQMQFTLATLLEVHTDTMSVGWGGL